MDRVRDKGQVQEDTDRGGWVNKEVVGGVCPHQIIPTTLEGVGVEGLVEVGGQGTMAGEVTKGQDRGSIPVEGQGQCQAGWGMITRTTLTRRVQG